MNRSYFYLLLLCLLAIITYLDRVCISVAGPRMQDALHISPGQWGLVGTVFLLSYGLFEIPSGHLGDRLGARKVLTRVVLWWSSFTVLTGAVSTYSLLLVVRFLFGAGEAGAFPNASIALSNWFPELKRGRALGLFIMSTHLGGALSPLLVIPIQQNFGWRTSFYIFGLLGVFWAFVWFWRFRDLPPGAARRDLKHRLDWLPILRSRSLWAIMLLAFAYWYTGSFFQTWFHTYLVKGRAFSEDALNLSALPYLLGAASSLAGGLTCDWLTRRAGLRWSRRGVGMAGLLFSGLAIIAALFATSHFGIILALSVAYSGITFQQPAVFAACLDLGGVKGGAVTGFMNMAAQMGGAISSAVFGYMADAYRSYNAPLIPMAVLLITGALAWLKVDVTKEI